MLEINGLVLLSNIHQSFCFPLANHLKFIHKASDYYGRPFNFDNYFHSGVMPLDLSKNYLFTLEGSVGNSVILIHFSIFLNNFYFYGLLKNVFFLFYQILQIMISSTHVSFVIYSTMLQSEIYINFHPCGRYHKF